MENPEEILHSLEEFSKLKPKDIPRELEEYLCFVAKTGDPVYQWGTVKSLFREKLINVITDFYESCPSVEIPPCPNVEVFNYELMKTFILEKLDTFAAAPFTVQRICELLTTPRKEYNRIDKYMRALEKNVLVVSTTEPGNRRTAENGEGIVNGLESEHALETNSTNNDINVEEMDDTPVWSRITPETVVTYQNTETNNANVELNPAQPVEASVHSVFPSDERTADSSCGSSIDSVITCRPTEEQPYVSIEPVASDSCLREDNVQESDVTVTITAIPAAVQKRRDSIEPIVVSTTEESVEKSTEPAASSSDVTEKIESSSPLPSTSTENRESSPAEVETLVSDNVTTSPAILNEDNTEISESSGVVSEMPDSVTTESPVIQIPIISEVTSGLSADDIEDGKETLAVNSPPIEVSANMDESIDIEKKGADGDSEVTDSSPLVTSTDDAIEAQEEICETLETETKETSVSSTDEISNDADDIELKTNSIDPTDDESRSYEPGLLQVNSDSSADCTSNASSEETRDKQSVEEAALNEQTFTSSSTSQDSMDVDIGEESCQEPPTSDG